MNYSELQKEQAAWSLAHFGKVPPDVQLLKVIAEIGELAEAHLCGLYGKRGEPVDAVDVSRIKVDAVGDIVIALCGYCTAKGWDDCIRDELWLIRKNGNPYEGWRSTPQYLRGIFVHVDNPRGILRCLIAYCHLEGIDFDDAVSATWAEVKQRTWGKA